MRRSAFLALMAAVGVLIWGGTGFGYENTNGVGYFALQVPDPSKMVIDGLDDDWAWFDPAYIIRSEPGQMSCTLTGVLPSKDDIDIAIKVGWSEPPDNQLYVFVHVTDDTLNIDETKLDAGWKDDDLEVITDADHSGTFHGPADGGGTRTDMQQWTFHIPTPGGYPQVAYMRYKQIPEMQWAINEGYVKAAVKVWPEAKHLATNVTCNYEIAMPLWDYYSPDGYDASTRHINKAHDLIGLSITYNEADSKGRTNQISTHINEKGAHDADYMSEFTFLPIGEYTSPIAVEPSTWGTIKSLLR